MKLKKNFWLASTFLALGLLLPAHAAIQTITDNFTSAANWGTPVIEHSGNIAVGSGRMNYTAPATNESLAGVVRKTPLLPATQDWSLRVNAHVAPVTLTAPGQFSRLYFGIGKAGDENNNHVAFEFGRAWVHGGYEGDYIKDEETINGLDVPNADNAFISTSVSSSDVSLRLDYAAANQTLTYYFDNAAADNGSNWVLEGVVSLASGPADLSLGPASTLTIILAGSSALQTVAAGQAYFTSLQITLNAADTSRPLLAITSPKAGQNISNSVFTAAGTVSDNVAVSNVLFSLNGSSWTAATLAANGSNWTAQLNLTPGPEVFQAYAVDTSGNDSLTNAVHFTNVLSAPLAVDLVGEGTISTNYNNQWLKIGVVYSMTAKATNGFTFVNWTDAGGDVLTNSATLKFVMASNLTFVANFVDLTKPTVSILSPGTSPTRLTNGLVTVQVRATDNVDVGNVEFHLNGQDFGPGAWKTGTNLWSRNFALAAGTNLVAVQAIDPAGNLSATKSVQLIYANSQTNASLITLSENLVMTIYPGPPGLLNDIVQDTGLLNATLKFPALQSLSADTWSNLFFSLSFGYFSFSGPLLGADRLTTNTAVFDMADPDDPSDYPAAEELSLRRNGSTLMATVRVGNAGNQTWPLSLIAGSYYPQFPYPMDPVFSQTPAFSLSLVDGDSLETYAATTNTVYLTTKYQEGVLLVTGAADFTAPTNTITAPASGLRWSNAVFTVTGTARDNVAVSDVWIQINGNGWEPAASANKWTNWSALAALTPGTNLVQACAMDASGNFSHTNSVSLIDVKALTLADYYPLPLGAQWLYSGTDAGGNPAYIQYQILSTNDSLTLYTGGKPARSYHTNCVEMAAAYLEADTLAPYDTWNEYWIENPRIGSFGWDDSPDQSSRFDGGVFYPAQLSVGQSATNKAGYYSFGTNVGTMTVNLQLLADSALTVAGGYFPDVLHLRWSAAGAGHTQVADFWWARGVGMIKKQSLSGSSDSWELVNYFIPSLTASNPPPVIALGNGSPGLSADRFEFDFSGQAGQTAIVEGSGDLVHWLPLQTNMVAGSAIHFADLHWTNYPCRFYRVRIQAP